MILHMIFYKKIHKYSFASLRKIWNFLIWEDGQMLKLKKKTKYK